MVCCAIGSCSNSNIKRRDVSFFCFPKDPKMRKIWIMKCLRKDKFNPLTARICSEHFTPDDYVRDLKAELLGIKPKRRLKPTAFPTINIFTRSDIDETKKILRAIKVSQGPKSRRSVKPVSTEITTSSVETIPFTCSAFIHASNIKINESISTAHPCVSTAVPVTKPSISDTVSCSGSVTKEINSVVRPLMSTATSTTESNFINTQMQSVYSIGTDSNANKSSTTASPSYSTVATATTSNFTSTHIPSTYSDVSDLNTNDTSLTVSSLMPTLLLVGRETCTFVNTTGSSCPSAVINTINSVADSNAEHNSIVNLSMPTLSSVMPKTPNSSDTAVCSSSSVVINSINSAMADSIVDSNSILNLPMRSILKVVPKTSISSNTTVSSDPSTNTINSVITDSNVNDTNSIINSLVPSLLIIDPVTSCSFSSTSVVSSNPSILTNSIANINGSPVVLISSLPAINLSSNTCNVNQLDNCGSNNDLCALDTLSQTIKEKSPPNTIEYLFPLKNDGDKYIGLHSHDEYIKTASENLPYFIGQDATNAISKKKLIYESRIKALQLELEIQKMRNMHLQAKTKSQITIINSLKTKLKQKSQKAYDGLYKAFNRMISPKMIKSLISGKKCNNWQSDYIDKAQTLKEKVHKKTYLYLRNHMGFPLPSISTLKRRAQARRAIVPSPEESASLVEEPE